MIDTSLIEHLRRRFALDWHGVHGISHWRRVQENGLRLASSTGARADVVEVPLHGPRAARLAEDLHGTAFELDPEGLDILMIACRDHSEGLMEGDPTVLTCWDADRLDLGRVGIRPRAELLCTPNARDPDVMGWAYRRSVG
ncbi:MAG: hypothetical protein ACREMD_06900 [Gemmatimonadota bacterium]